MPLHTREVVEKFCDMCRWVHQSWQTRKFLFDENPDIDELKGPHYAHFFVRLSYMLQEYWIQQLAKLHDPAIQRGHKNLSIDYMIDHGQWDLITKSELIELRDKMMVFESKLRTVRDKIIAHNDLTSILQSNDLGEFDQEEDTLYFQHLEAFASIVQKVSLGELFLYDDVRNDIDFFMTAFNRGRIIPRR
jgi:hypothetical protein